MIFGIGTIYILYIGDPSPAGFPGSRHVGNTWLATGSVGLG